jgi:hypothetical protein
MTCTPVPSLTKPEIENFDEDREGTYVMSRVGLSVDLDILMQQLNPIVVHGTGPEESESDIRSLHYPASICLY